MPTAGLTSLNLLATVRCLQLFVDAGLLLVKFGKMLMLYSTFTFFYGEDNLGYFKQ